MKFLTQSALTIALCFPLQYFFPWWTLAIGAGVAGYVVDNKGYLSILAGFVGAGILWAGVAFYGDFTTGAILSTKVNHLLPVPALLMATLVGGLVGGLSAMTGTLFRKWWTKNY